MHEFAVDINKVLADINVMSCVKDVFRSLSKTGYLTPKTYFEQLSEVDLSTLMLMSADMDSEKTSEAALHQLTMLTIGFLVGENSPVSEGNVEESLKYVVLMITLESLARKGLIKPLRGNWCLSGDPKALWAESIE